MADTRLAIGRIAEHQHERRSPGFHHRPAAPTKSVALVGTFTDWKERPLAMTGPDARGNYATTIALDPGSHEYKFLIDGETFRHDPGNPESAGFFHNSLIRLP